ncbi:MAG: hypothetical protein JZU53_14295 [Paludibacter sp.]|nr:hypothetical protein [Paludibacter sp.]
MKKITNLLIITFVVSVVCLISCDDNNSMHDKYLANGEDFLVGKLDSFHYYGGDQRARIVVWARDFRATKLKISRADSSLTYNYQLSNTNRKDSMVFYINTLKEGTNVLSMKTWNADSTVSSIPMGFTVTTWGTKFKSFLKARKIATNKFSTVTKAFTISWDPSNVIEPSFGKYALGHEILYVNTDGVQTLIRDVYTNQSTPTSSTVLAKFPATGGSFSYRMMFMPDISSIDTFRTEYTTVSVP